MANVCFCTHPGALHWFNTDRCVECRCPRFDPVESSVAAPQDPSTEVDEEQPPPQDLSDRPARQTQATGDEVDTDREVPE